MLFNDRYCRGLCVCDRILRISSAMLVFPSAKVADVAIRAGGSEAVISQKKNDCPPKYNSVCALSEMSLFASDRSRI